MKRKYFKPKSKIITSIIEPLLVASQDDIEIGTGGGGPAGAKRNNQIWSDEDEENVIVNTEVLL